MDFWSGFRWADIAAIVGALAWLPVIVRFFQQPVVTIIHGGTIEIGFTGYGPIFNPSLAFRTQQKDALVTGLEFVVTHERGQRATFKSVSLIETPGVTQSTSGESAVHQRTQAAVAVVLTPASIAERKVACQELQHLAGFQDRVVAFQAAVKRLQEGAADMGEWQRAVLASPECHALRDFWTREFFWQQGRFTVSVSAKVAELRRPAVTTFYFDLTDAQVQLLRNNLIQLEREIWRLARAAGMPLDEQASPSWHWEYSQTDG